MWRREGYNVSGLEELFENREIESIRNVSDRFEKIVQGIRGLEKEANILGIRELEAEVRSLKSRTRDLNKIGEIGEYVSKLQRKIGEFKEFKRREWEKKIIGWGKRGYEAPVFKKYLEEYSVQAEEKLRKYEQAIGELEQLKENLKSFNISGFGFEVFTIEKNMKEGQDIDKTIGEISALKAKTEEKAKEEMEKWIDEAIRKVRKHVKTLEQST
ncbi:MAG: hypothetical protein QXR44_04115 [Thermoproteota archaeon]